MTLNLKSDLIWSGKIHSNVRLWLIYTEIFVILANFVRSLLDISK